MSAESGPPAVFLSYASQDAGAAKRISDALQAGGIQVWFDQSALRGGDAWDQKIRREIRDCALFIPIISAHTASRPEGYFRLEWAIADQRTQMIARNKAFIVPVCVDGTPEGIADLPDSFHRVQWTRLPGGETPRSFCDRIAHLLTGRAPSFASAAAAAVLTPPPTAAARRAALPIVIAGLAACALAAFAIVRHVSSDTAASHASSAIGTPRTATAGDSFSPPPHSLAVLPFVNMSADKQQDYFSDGLSEELLDSLAKVHDLQVAARTSSFSFKGEKVEIAEIARKLNVGAILEGSVRRDGNRVRITAQLINALTGFHVWSETYDRDLKNVLALQSEIATAVTGALQATLLPEAAAAIETGGTQNAAALDAYLRGKTLARDDFSQQREQAAIAAFESAFHLDPKFAKAYASFAVENTSYSNNFARENELALYGQRARSAAQKSVELAPDLGESHAAMAYVMERIALDFPGARREYARALELSPNDAEILSRSGGFYLVMGLRDRGLVNLRRALLLDPLNTRIWTYVANYMEVAGESAEATNEVEHALALNPDSPIEHSLRGMIALDQGDADRAIANCTMTAPIWQARFCLALSYDKLHKRPESDAQITAMLADLGNSSAYQLAAIYAQRGDIPKAVEWLETAYRLRDPGLSSLKSDRLLDPVRGASRFVEIERKLFPES